MRGDGKAWGPLPVDATPKMASGHLAEMHQRRLKVLSLGLAPCTASMEEVQMSAAVYSIAEARRRPRRTTTAMAKVQQFRRFFADAMVGREKTLQARL